MGGIDLRDEIAPVVLVGALVGAYVYLVVAQLTIPDHLEAFVASVVSYYLGNRARQGNGHKNGATPVAAAIVEAPQEVNNGQPSHG